MTDVFLMIYNGYDSKDYNFVKSIQRRDKRIAILEEQVAVMKKTINSIHELRQHLLWLYDEYQKQSSL